MRILMISLDKTLLGSGDYQGDTISRHQNYGSRVESLDIIVLTKPGFKEQKLSDRVFVWPTNSSHKLTYFFDGYKTALKIYKERSYDLIVVQDYCSPLGWFLKKKLKLPFLINFHGDYLENKYWLREDLFNFFWLGIFKWLARKAGGLRVVSSGIKEKFIKLGIKAAKVRVINTPINVERYDEIDEQKVKLIKQKYKNKKIILYVGRLVKLKNIPLLFEIIKELSFKKINLKLLIIGQGQELKFLKNKVNQDNLQSEIEFLNPLPHDQIINYFKAADLFILPSYHESFGKVLVEAGLAGRPVIATLTTGAKDIVISGQTGYLVPIGDKQEIIKKSYQLLTDDRLAQEMGKKAREFLIEKFDQKTTIDKMIKFWQELINNE